MTLESLTLTPFCMEILGIKMDISMLLAVFSVGFWLGSGKMCKNKSTFFIFTFFFLQISPVFFSPGQDQLLERAGHVKIGPVSAPVIALYMSFGSQGWTALLELVDTAGPEV